ncbi:MAG: hypothetical protein M3Z25_21260 [Actinomycetota bacterium]|nr:hypothetical protein [Actinomycetota bacterium]
MRQALRAEHHVLMSETLSNVITFLLLLPLVWVGLYLASQGETVLVVAIGVVALGMITHQAVRWFGVPWTARMRDPF